MSDIPDPHQPDPGELMRLRQEANPAGLIVHVTGEVDLSTAPDLSKELIEAERRVAPPGPLVINLTDVSFLASVGLSVLVDHDRRCREAGIELRVVAGNRVIARAILVTGLNDTLTVVDTLGEAVNTGD